MLLTAGVLALAALWLLARIRFPERPVTPNPVTSVLSQLATGPKYDDLAGEITQIQARLQSSLIALGSSAVRPLGTTPLPAAALRLRDDLALAVAPAGPAGARWAEATTLAVDPASGLAVVRLAQPGPPPPPVSWAPRVPQQSRFLAASDVSPNGVSLRPVFVGSFDPVDSPLWPDAVWAVPRRTDLTPGSFLFTSSAEFAGLVIVHGTGLAIVPGRTVLDQAERLVGAPPGPPGTIGVDVQELTPALESVTGAHVGVVVTAVDAERAASEHLVPGDVIEAIDGQTLLTRQYWDVRLARLAAGETVTLRVRRRDAVREIALAADPRGAAPPAAPEGRPLGLTLRPRAGAGAEVTRVDAGSAAARANLVVGDVITRIDDVAAPTPSQVARTFAAIPEGERVLVVVTRGASHLLTTLER
jgi:hypothetical protein